MREKKMEKKYNLTSIAEAGMKVIAKIKDRAIGGRIIPQNITYTEKPMQDKSVRDAVNQVAEAEFQEERIEAVDEVAENTFFKVESITSKLESIKKSLSEVIAKSEAKKDELLKSGLKKEDLQEELSKTVSEIEEKLNSVKTIMDKTSDYVSDVIAENLQAVSENVLKTDKKLETLEDALNKANKKVGEIHETTVSINKLYDSVFELKASNVENKNIISELQLSQKKIFKLSVWTLVIGSVALAAALAILAVLIFA